MDGLREILVISNLIDIHRYVFAGYFFWFAGQVVSDVQNLRLSIQLLWYAKAPLVWNPGKGESLEVKLSLCFPLYLSNAWLAPSFSRHQLNTCYLRVGSIGAYSPISTEPQFPCNDENVRLLAGT